jgi:thioredoxin 1
MSPSPQDQAGRTPARESSGRVRHLYLIEVVLGAALVALVVGIFLTNGQRGGSEHVVQLTAANWQKEVVDSPVPVVVDFYADWCGPCRQIAPIIDKVATRYAGRVKVGKLNIDDNQKVRDRYLIDSIPRVYIFSGGEEPRKTIVGLVSETTLVREINSVLP